MRSVSNLFVTSDLHHGHKSILNWQGHTRGGSDLKEHSLWLVEQWNSVVSKRDTVIVLGDVIFDKMYTKYLKMLNGQKRMVYGNHDKFSIRYYVRECNFQTLHGFYKKHDLWFSHCPIHPHELRGKVNVHGHKHSGPIMILGEKGELEEDLRYFNVCVDLHDGKPVSIEAIKERKLEI